MKKNISIVFFLCSVLVGTSFAQCEADYTVIVKCIINFVISVYLFKT